jgi:hypothetical protein
MPAREALERFIAEVESNRHVEAIEKFYTEEASMQENERIRRKGRDVLVAHERKALSRMRSVRSRCVRPVFVDGDRVVIRWIFEFETVAGTRMRMDELACQRWEGDRIAEEKFFYDPRQLEPPVTLFAAGEFRAMEMGELDVARLQQFFEENPAYHLAVNGEPPSRTHAREEFDDLPPPDMRYDKRWMLKIEDRDGALVAHAGILSNFLAESVWHIGLYVVATRMHGSGEAGRIYAALEDWMRKGGARWARLGVVAGNARAERFWEKAGYVEVRRRLAVPMGARINDLRVMVKPLTGGAIDDYLALVARDRPDTP